MILPTLSRLRTPGLLLIMLTALLTASCHSGRSVAGSGSSYESHSGKALPQSELKKLLTGLESSYSSWDDVKVPVTLRLKSPKKFSIGGTMTMQRDRSLHLSLRFLGMEVAALMVTQDSIFALYKLEKLYFAESISDLLGGFPATVSNVQDLLLGRPFILGDSKLTASRCKLEGGNDSWTITPTGSPDGMSYSFTVDTPTGNIESLSVTAGSRKPTTAEYSDFSTSPSGPFAGSSTLTASTSRLTLSAEIDLNARRAEWDTGASRTWATPKGYTRVTAAEIMHIVSTRF